MRIALFVVLLSAMVQSVSAAGPQFGYNFSVSPQPAVSTDTLTVTIEAFTAQCTPLPNAIGLEDLGSGVMQIALDGSDACSSAPPETRIYTVGSLPPGNYVFRFAKCGINVLPGMPDCVTLQDVPVLVYGVASTPFTIPALSLGGVLTLVLLALCFGYWARRDG